MSKKKKSKGSKSAVFYVDESSELYAGFLEAYQQAVQRDSSSPAQSNTPALSMEQLLNERQQILECLLAIVVKLDGQVRLTAADLSRVDNSKFIRWERDPISGDFLLTVMAYEGADHDS